VDFRDRFAAEKGIAGNDGRDERMGKEERGIWKGWTFKIIGTD